MKGFAAALGNAQKFKKMTGMTWKSMVKDGLAMRRGKDLTWSQVVMAANTPMLLKAVWSRATPMPGAGRGGRHPG